MPDLVAAMKAAHVEGRLSCQDAFAVAARLGVEPRRVGDEATRWGIRISACQLGFFGHAVQGKGRIVEPAGRVAPDLEDAIRRALVEGRLPCRSAWDIATQFGLTRLETAGASERLEVRISLCQLGCFD